MTSGLSSGSTAPATSTGTSRMTLFRPPTIQNRRRIQRRRHLARKPRLRQVVPSQNHQTRLQIKLPLIIYTHGGGFSIESAFSSTYHPYINALASESRSVVVSVEYRLAPEHPIPACYDDSYAALKWFDSHSRPGKGPDPWLNEHADFQRVYLAGDSAGANIAHNTLIRAKSEGGFGLNFSGLVLVHPFFGSGRPDRLWDYACPESGGADDVRLHPMAHPGMFPGLGCGRVLVCVAEKDALKERGLNYYVSLKKSDWNGVVEMFETPEEQHVFHLSHPTRHNAVSLMTRIVDFINCNDN